MTHILLARAVPGRRRHAPPSRARNGHGIWPWLFLAPALTGLAVFYGWPIIQNAFFSFTQWGVFGGYDWAGVANYARIFEDAALWRSLLNTAVYTLIVLLGVPVSVYLARVLTTPGLRFLRFYRVAFFAPYVAMPVAVAMVWRVIFNGDFGLVNWALSLVGIAPIYWLSTPGWALAVVGLLGMWISIGFNVVVLIAGLQNIPSELYEAAKLDGASDWQSFLRITVPLVTPTIFFLLVVNTIASLQVFDTLFGLLGASNPALRDTESIVYFFYKTAFVLNDKGYGAAIAMLILAVIGIVTWVQFWFQKRWVHQ